MGVGADGDGDISCCSPPQMISYTDFMEISAHVSEKCRYTNSSMTIGIFEYYCFCCM